MAVCDDTFKARGLCGGADPELFFPQRGAKDVPTKTAEAKRICGLCPVKDLCLEWALTTRETTGIWGGATVTERREMLKNRPTNRRAAPRRPLRTHCMRGLHVYNEKTTYIDGRNRRSCRLCMAATRAAKAARDAALVLAA